MEDSGQTPLIQMRMADTDSCFRQCSKRVMYESFNPHDNPVRLILFPHFTDRETEIHRSLLSVFPDIIVNDRWSWDFEFRLSGCKAYTLTHELCQPSTATTLPPPPRT